VRSWRFSASLGWVPAWPLPSRNGRATELNDTLTSLAISRTERPSRRLASTSGAAPAGPAEY